MSGEAICRNCLQSEREGGKAQEHLGGGTDTPKSVQRPLGSSTSREAQKKQGMSFGDRFKLLWGIGFAISLIYSIATDGWEWFFSGVLISAVVAIAISLVVECLRNGIRIGVARLLKLVGGGVAMISCASIAFVAQERLEGGILSGSIIALVVGLVMMGMGFGLERQRSD